MANTWQIDEDPTAGVSVDTSAIPICVTFFLIGSHFVVDVDLDEECCSSSRVLVRHAVERVEHAVIAGPV